MTYVLGLLRTLLAAIMLSVVPASAAPPLDPTDFGAVFDGATDDSAAWNATIAASAALKVGIKAPCGQSRIASAITIDRPMIFEGSGQECTQILLSTAATVGIEVTTSGPVTLRDFTLSCTASQIGVRIAPMVPNAGSLIDRLDIFNCINGLVATNTTLLTVDRSRISVSTRVGAVGMTIGNTTNPDSGDSFITNSVFSGADVGAAAIVQKSSGGLKIDNNKILRWGECYKMDLQGTTVDLLLSNNSMEWCGFVLSFKKTGAVTFHSVVVVGNQFSGCGTAVRNWSGVGWLFGVGVVGNVMNCTTDFSMGGSPIFSADNF